MSSYISSSDNRFYAVLEESYGAVPQVVAGGRFPAVRLSAKQVRDQGDRRDKTGGRTFAGMPAGLRRRTTFDLRTYMTGWTNPSVAPAHGALFQAALGGAARVFAGGAVESAIDARTVRFANPHGVSVGQAVANAVEIRFVTAIPDSRTVQFNAPFSTTPEPGAPMGPTASFAPASELKSVSIFDYWDPQSSVQRLLCGAAVDRFSVKLNGDFHEFEFSGAARDLIDSASFSTGLGELSEYPAEPAAAEFDYAVIPGHLGQVWLGGGPDRFFTITSAELELDNDLELRNREFGSDGPRAVSAGVRSVRVNLSLYEQDDAATKALYQAARQRSPISVMFQLGQQAGQLFGAYLKSVIPEVPEFDDREARLQWNFTNCRAQGTADDELFVAFA